MEQIEHDFDISDIDENYSVPDYIVDATKAVEKIRIGLSHGCEFSAIDITLSSHDVVPTQEIYTEIFECVSHTFWVPNTNREANNGKVFR